MSYKTIEFILIDSGSDKLYDLTSRAYTNIIYDLILTC